MRLTTVGTAVLLLLAAACSRAGGDSGRAGNVVPTAPATTSTTVDPFAVPTTIDAAYVNKVLTALDAAFGDILRLYVRDRRITGEIEVRMKALYESGRAYDTEVAIIEQDKETKVASAPGNQVTTVTRLISASPSCIYAQVERDYRPVVGRIGTVVQWVGLHPTAVSTSYNPTRWMYALDGFTPDRSQPPNPCTGP